MHGYLFLQSCTRIIFCIFAPTQIRHIAGPWCGDAQRGQARHFPSQLRHLCQWRVGGFGVRSPSSALNSFSIQMFLLDLPVLYSVQCTWKENPPKYSFIICYRCIKHIYKLNIFRSFGTQCWRKLLNLACGKQRNWQFYTYFCIFCNSCADK